jgi:two-component system, sporulation sensor kinase E
MEVTIMTGLARVLVVDDEVELMTALCDSLAERGYEASGFTSGMEALTVLQKQSFNILLLDLMMPGMNGIEVLKKALTIDPNVICIIMTGYGTVETAVKAMKAGAFDFVLKPFNMEMILPVLLRAMEMSRLRSENFHLRESKAINDLMLAVSLSLDRNDILNKTANVVIEQCGADEISILLPTGNSNEFYVALVKGEQAKGRIGDVINIAKDSVEWEACQCGTELQRDTVTDSLTGKSQVGLENESPISIPLIVGGRCVGIMNVRSRKRTSFTLGKIKALKILASAAASALENARLYTEVQKAEQNYRSIFENSSEGIFQITPDGCYSLVNPSMAQILGYDKPEDLVSTAAGVNYEEILAGEQQKAAVERQICRRDGSVIWVSENIRAVCNDQGKILYYEGTMEDITQRKDAERIKQELARLDRLNIVGELAASISHEIRNPMTSVRGFLQMLKSIEDCQPYHDYYDLMIEELDRANTIISDYLNMAKNKPLELCPGHLNRIIESLYPMIQADARYRDNQVKLDLDDPPMVSMDEKEIRQLVINMARNGLEAMAPGGTLVIGTCAKDDEAILFIKDEGPGIDQHVLDRLGTPFLTTKENGTGLGLAVCFGIASRHNAEIKVDTSPTGTTFWIRFHRGEMAETQALYS